MPLNDDTELWAILELFGNAIERWQLRRRQDRGCAIEPQFVRCERDKDTVLRELSAEISGVDLRDAEPADRLLGCSAGLGVSRLSRLQRIAQLRLLRALGFDGPVELGDSSLGLDRQRIALLTGDGELLLELLALLGVGRVGLSSLTTLSFQCRAFGFECLGQFGDLRLSFGLCRLGGGELFTQRGDLCAFSFERLGQFCDLSLGVRLCRLGGGELIIQRGRLGAFGFECLGQFGDLRLSFGLCRLGGGELFTQRGRFGPFSFERLVSSAILALASACADSAVAS